MSNRFLISKKLKIVAPGDKLAVIEEFSPSEGTYVNESLIRALKLGVVRYNQKKKEIKIEPLKKIKIPKVGDSIIGQVESIQSNIANVRIHYINNERISNNFTGMLILKPGIKIKRGKEKTIVCKLGDIIRAKVTSYNNATIHLSINDNENGVIYTRCSSCGGNVIRINGRVRCVDCGLVEERKLAFDFGKAKLK
ncbi:MAG: exosome complex RNA-binding protein Csl4 [Nitrososphaerales archaeon]